MLFQQSTRTFVYYSSQRGLCTVVFPLVITDFGYLLQSTWTVLITVVNVDCVLQFFLQASRTLVIYVIVNLDFAYYSSQRSWTVYCSFSFSHHGLWLFIIVYLDFAYYGSQRGLCTVVDSFLRPCIYTFIVKRVYKYTVCAESPCFVPILLL